MSPNIPWNYFFISVKEKFECTNDKDQITDQHTNFLVPFGGVKLLPKVIIKGLSLSTEALISPGSLGRLVKNGEGK